MLGVVLGDAGLDLWSCAIQRGSFGEGWYTVKVEVEHESRN